LGIDKNSWDKAGRNGADFHDRAIL